MSASEPQSGHPSPSSDVPPERENKRIGVIAAFRESLAHVKQAAGDKAVTIRETDKQSVRILRGSVLAALVFLFLPLAGLGRYAIVCLIAADLFFLFALTIFIVVRFGILRVMSPRHALVCWQLMVGTSLFSMALAVNGAFILVMVLAGQYLMKR